MTKAELIEKIAKSRDLPPDVTKKCVQQIVDLAFEELGAYFVRARVTKTHSPRFTVPGFGTFSKKKRCARKGVNPRTLEPMVIDASYTIDFRPGVELRRALNGERVRALNGDAARSREERPHLGLVPPLESAREEYLDDEEVDVEVEAGPLRRLRSRDEAEYDEGDEPYDVSLFGEYELAEPPMQRVRARRLPTRESGMGEG